MSSLIACPPAFPPAFSGRWRTAPVFEPRAHAWRERDIRAAADAVRAGLTPGAPGGPGGQEAQPVNFFSKFSSVGRAAPKPPRPPKRPRLVAVWSVDPRTGKPKRAWRLADDRDGSCRRRPRGPLTTIGRSAATLCGARSNLPGQKYHIATDSSSPSGRTRGHLRLSGDEQAQA